MQKVERLPYFSFYVADYLLDTGDLSFTEHGAYCLMMFRYYWNGELDAADKYRAARTPEDRAAVDSVMARFFHEENGRIVHNRIEREIEKIGAFVKHQSKAGKASAAARAGKKHESKPRGNGATFTPPDWVIVAKWDAWVKIRPAKARTPEALAAAIEKLEKFRAQGHDGNAIVANSLSNGWQGLFPPDQKHGRASVAEHNRLAGEEAQRRFEAEHGKE